MKYYLTFFCCCFIVLAKAQSTGYGAGRPKKGPVLPPVEYARKKDSIKIPQHQDLTIILDFAVDEADFLSGMKVAEIKGDMSDKAYVNACILQAFETIRQQHPGKTPGKKNAKVKKSQPMFFPAK